MQNRRYDGVIFDFDGTLVDTGEGILKSLQFAFEDHGRPIPTVEDLKKFIGPPIYYSFTTFYNVSEEEVGDYIKSYRKRYKEKGIYECKLYDGMEQTLRALKKGGVCITSGILEGYEDSVRRAAAAAGLTEIEETRQGEWVSLTFRKE